MDYKVLLLTFLFVVVVKGQTTEVTTPPTPATKSDQGSSTKSDQGSSTKFDQGSSTKSDQGSSTKAEDGDSTESASTEEDDLKAEASSNRFSFTEADALLPKKTLSPKPDNDLGALGDEEDPIQELTMFQKLLSGSAKANDDDETPDAKTTDSKTAAGDNDNDDDKDDDDNDDDKDDDDDDNDEEGDEDSDEEEESVPKPSYGAIASGPAQQLRRQGDLKPGFGLGSSNVEDSRQNQDKPDSPVPVYMPAGEQINAQETSNDGSPLLQLTEGGYKRPYQRLFRFEDQRPNMRAGSASQQSETLEAPRAGGDQAGPLVPQVEYSTPYQPQLGARPAFQPSGGFAASGILPGGLQNGFFNTPPAGFTDFSSANFQTQFHPSDNGGFSAVPRDQGFSLFQTSPRQNGMLFQGAPQYPHSQPMMDSYPRPQTLFHPNGFTNFPNLDIVDDTRPNYSPYMRHPAMNQQQFHVNPNFYGTLPMSGVNDFNNAGINLQPSYPGNAERQAFQPQLFRYPLPNNPITLQTSDQVDKQKPDSTDPMTDPKSKDSDDSLKASQDKEDPTSVPFGARINAPGQKDVYLRYPIREAGYATEENLPVQNTTEKTTKNTDPSSNPPFQIFAAAEEFRPFNADPFSALHALQRSYPNNRNVDDNNETRAPVDQFARHAPAPFDARPPTHPFSPYQGNQEAPVFQNRPFFPVPGLDSARNPFYQLNSLPENRYPFSGPGSARNADGSVKIPTCAQDTNSSVCFEDADYPKRELLYALNSNPYFMERLSGPSQVVEEIAVEDQTASDDQDSEDNYICKSNVKVGLPLRAKNIKGTWKVIVNVDKDSGNTEFVQSVRLEMCSAVNQPCSFTQGKTACKQKYNLQLLLSWDPEKGLHNDMYKLPIACACQIQK